MMVIPGYLYNIKSVKDGVLIGEMVAIGAIIMCLLFVVVDLGRPDRMWHLIPGIIQRVRKGLNPACLEVCPTGSRKFGNILDPDSDIRYILENKRVYVLKESLGTIPSFYYFFD